MAGVGGRGSQRGGQSVKPNWSLIALNASFASQIEAGTSDFGVSGHDLAVEVTGDPFVDGEVTAAGDQGWVITRTPNTDNLELCAAEFVLEAGIYPADGELQGEGREVLRGLIDAAIDVARSEGRRYLVTEATWPGSEAHPFEQELRSRGFRLAHNEFTSAYNLREHPLTSLDPLPPEFAVVQYDSVQPPAPLANGVIRLYNQANRDLPHGLLPRPDTRWDQHRLEAAQAKAKRQGLIQSTTAILDSRGAVVGLSETTFGPAPPCNTA